MIILSVKKNPHILLCIYKACYIFVIAKLAYIAGKWSNLIKRDRFVSQLLKLPSQWR